MKFTPKTNFLITVFILCNLTLLNAQTSYIELKNQLIMETIDAYIDQTDFLIDGKFGYVEVKLLKLRGHDFDELSAGFYDPYRFEIDTLHFQIWSHHYDVILWDNLPAMYTIRKGVPVLIYTGFERFIDFNDNKKFSNKISKYLHNGKRNFGWRPTEKWKIKSINGEVDIIKEKYGNTIMELY